MKKLARYVSPERWKRFIGTRVELVRRARAESVLDASWQKIGPVRRRSGPATVLADGLWLNPGYFLRLRLMVEALASEHAFDLVGILRTPRHTSEKRALQRIGFSEFIYIDADPQITVVQFNDPARILLENVKSHEDLLRIQLPHGFPAYLWYDSVLKDTRHARPPIGDPAWQKSLAETLACLAIYERTLQENRVSHVLLSHAWGSEWVAMAWLALKRGIPVFLVTAFSESIRIRRFRSVTDLKTPVEYLPRPDFDALTANVRRKITEFGAEQLSIRQGKETSDINIRFAYAREFRTTDREKARAMLGVSGDKPVGVIYGHSWFDFPHLYGMENFTDFLDWFEVTLEAISKLDHVTWLLKPHPMESWYGGYKMIENLGDLPPHIRVLSGPMDTLTTMSAADAIITVHGTAALEAAAKGVPVIAADRSYYADWGFAHTATNRSHYVELLSQVGMLIPPTSAQRDLALACFALTYAEPSPDIGALRVPCDSLGSVLFDEVRRMVTAEPQQLASEKVRLARFLQQDEIDSFAAYALVDAMRAQDLTVAA